MRTQNNYKKFFKKLTCAGITGIAILLTNIHASAQTKTPANFGIRLSSTVSANRFGAILSPSCFYNTGRQTFIAGLTLQRNHMNLTGLQINYEYTVLDPCLDADCNMQWLQLFGFVYTGYHQKAFLSKAVCEEERSGNPELNVKIEDLNLKAVEAYAGFGVRIKILRSLKWFGAIGIGGYRVLNPVQGLYYNDKAIGLLLRTGLAYRFSNTKKESF